MHTRVSLILLALGLVFTSASYGKDARSILQAVQDKQIERWDGVDTYAVVRTAMGQRVTMCYRRTEVVGADKKSAPVFMPLPPEECYAGDQQQLTAEDYDNMAGAYEMTGQAMGDEIESRMTEMGLPPGLLAATGSDPWATMDPRIMFGGGAKMFRSVAAHKREQAANPEDPAAVLDEMVDFAEAARLVGTEKLDGRRAYHLHAADMNNVQMVDGKEFVLNDAHLWIDTDWLVPVRTKFEGVLNADGKSQPVTIEKIDSDFRAVAGSQMFEPFRQETKMTGLMDEAQQQEMAKARQQMAEMDAKMASMTPAQRAQVEAMMGGQLEMARNNAQGDAFTAVMITDEILVNPDPEALRTAQQSGAMFGSPMPAGPTVPPAPQAPAAGTAPSVATVPSAATVPATAATQGQDQAEQDCLKQKIAEAQAAQKKKRGLGRLFSGLSRVAGKIGGRDVTNGIAQTTAEVSDANATAADLSAAAKDLGLTEGDIASCRKTTKPM